LAADALTLNKLDLLWYSSSSNLITWFRVCDELLPFELQLEGVADEVIKQVIDLELLYFHAVPKQLVARSIRQLGNS